MYSEAAHEDFFVGGTWTDELMRTDYALYVEHRRGAKATVATRVGQAALSAAKAKPSDSRRSGTSEWAFG